MNYNSIELLLLQLEEAFSKSRSNIYSDQKKERHFLQLHELFLAIKSSDYKILNSNDLAIHFDLLNYIFKGLEYLDNSTLNIIPYEIVSCLEYALEDWIDKDGFIIVTSLSNKNLDFYFEANYSVEYFNNLNLYINSFYNLKISHRLIRISLPKVLSRDYLSIVVLYHELGHFVDNELKISLKLLQNQHGFKLDYLEKERSYYHHCMEYFADLFAAQYINNASSTFLEHITIIRNDRDSHTHPSTSKRNVVVKVFLSGKTCKELNQFNTVLSASSCPILKIRHSEIPLRESDFLNLIPQNINDKKELHYIFKLGWEFWEGSGTNFLKSFKPRQKYHIINNLIEKSISNFTIQNEWERVSSKNPIN